MSQNWRMIELPPRDAHGTGAPHPASTIPLRIGHLTLATPLLLAPMAGYTDLAFRRIVRQLGGLGLAFTEMISPSSVLRGRNARSRAIIATAPDDQPLGFQIYGSDAALLRDAALSLESSGARIIDLNMGCPQRKISRLGAGAGLLRDPEKAVRIAAAVSGAVKIPVMAKLRLGWDQETKNAAEVARALAGAGIAAITIHGRTRGQGYMGAADLEGIRAVVAAVPAIPVIGNGDITSPKAAVEMFDRTGCAGIMLGRGVLRDPWLLRDTWRYLAGQPPLPTPSRADRLRLMLNHLEGMAVLYGPHPAALLFRKWIPFYSHGLGINKPEMVALLQISTLEKLKATLVTHGSPP